MRMILFVPGTGLDWSSCPAGTYSSQDLLYAQSQCLACPGGKYCQGVHQTTFTGDCDPGAFLLDLKKNNLCTPVPVAL